ncbi:MAG TPA: hypothetical protein VKH18_14775 [Terriglobales bacterium]|nr:hypothetical protein [Terriglobales bacterium]
MADAQLYGSRPIRVDRLPVMSAADVRRRRAHSVTPVIDPTSGKVL